MVTVIDLFLRFSLIYLIIGFVFALYFLRWGWGLGRLDSGAREAKWSFKLLILPGSVVLWPVLIVKLIMSKSQN